MKQILLLFAKKSVESGLADPTALAQLLNASGRAIDTKWAYFDDLVYYISNEQSSIYDSRNAQNLRAYGAIYFRYWGQQQGHATATARICKQLHIPFIDQEVFRDGSYSKLTQYVNLAAAGVPIPRTLIGSADNLVRHYAQYNLRFPLIMKALGGTRGQDNYLVHSEREMQQLLQKHSGTDFLLQTYIENDGDYRVVVMGDKVVLLIRRTAAAGTHLNNTSQGGSAEMVQIDELPKTVQKLCVQAAQFFKRDVAGVDIVKSKTDGKYYCFEVNRAPQIEHASFETEKAALLADYLANL